MQWFEEAYFGIQTRYTQRHPHKVLIKYPQGDWRNDFSKFRFLFTLGSVAFPRICRKSHKREEVDLCQQIGLRLLSLIQVPV